MGLALCPECEAIFDLRPKQAIAGTLFFCPECETELEVVSTNPLEVDYIRDPLSGDWPVSNESAPAHKGD